MNTKYAMCLALLLGACGGEDRPQGDCIPGVSDRYLPFAVGDSWSYKTYDAMAPADVFDKSQSVTEERNHPDDGMPMLVQQTIKVNGSTENWLRFDGERLVRLTQIDYDADGLEERTTVYDPSRLRLDESPARLVKDATWQESYAEIETDAITQLEERRDITETWTVIDVDVPCPGDDFGDFDCLYIQRAEVGQLPKEFWYSRGMGKIREQGLQIEELQSCSLQ